MVKETNFSHLTEDLVIDVFSRLPVKCLLESKRVCKNWYALIDNPIFIQKHLHYPNHPTNCLVHNYFTDTMKSGFTMFHEENQLVSKSHLYQDVLNTTTCLWEVLGPLNGLFLLYNDQEDVTLWNPALNQFKTLPIFQPMNYPTYQLSSYKFGLGIDPSSNDYKVVSIRDYWDNLDESLCCLTTVSVYTTSTNSWRHFEEYEFCSRDMVKSIGNTYFNGFYYWKARDNCKIVAFDMSKEKIGEIQTPDCFEFEKGDLAMYKDYIAMYLHEPIHDRQTCIDIWVMEKEGFWNKKLRVGPFFNLKRSLGYGNNGEFMLEFVTRQLDLFDTNIQKSRVLGHQRNGYSLQAFAYQESLVPLRKASFLCS